MNACEFNSMLGRYHDGELPVGERGQLELHLSGCAECSSEVEQMQAISQTLRAQMMPRASANFMSQLEALGSNLEDVMVMRFVRRLTAVAAAILLAATLQWAIHSPPAAQPVVISPPSTDERMIIDPETAANNAVPDNNNVVIADAQLGPLAGEFSGGQP